LAWTEALTTLDRKTNYGALRAALRDHFNDECGQGMLSYRTVIRSDGDDVRDEVM
jgi:hypothetical protein